MLDNRLKNYKMMGNFDAAILDWVNLPSDTEVESLWICLHDCKIISIKSNLLVEEVMMEIDAFFLSENLRVHFLFHKVRSVRVDKLQRPYESLLTPVMTWKEQNDIASHWVDRWREESMGWDEFEKAQSTDPMDIADATLAVGKDRVAFKMSGILNGDKYDDLWCNVFIRGEKLTVTRSDGLEYSIEKFIEAGGKWWEEFRKDNENIF